MTTRKSTSKTAAKRTPKASETQEQQAATPQPNAGDSAQAPEAGGVEATQVKDAATQEPAMEPAAKEGPSDAAQDQPKASEKGEKINTPPGEAPVEQVPAVFVRTRKRYGSRRRAGFRFTQEGLGIALSALTDEQLEQLHADPALEVEECTFPADDDGEPEQ
ncbi:HI1506-related protein [Halomonas sp.]|uniref:HI1506-related protein n=1 Tax=Halomonas sp. TaxID=1486246 RepID=UPI00298ECF6F|nr:HI1506-related protein [Halomonas sp.]MDW7746582.1 HI1506-related protein [Halomonas sp.]